MKVDRVIVFASLVFLTVARLPFWTLNRKEKPAQSAMRHSA